MKDMKMNKLIIGIVVTGIFITACTKNETGLDVNVSLVNNDQIMAGQEVIFNVTGQAEFITFYSGNDSASNYNNYPLASGLPVDVGEVKYVYNKQGIYNAAFIASSFSDWGSNEKMMRIDFEINVIDNRTGIMSFSVKTSGLFGKVYYGTIDEEAGTINVETPPGTKINKLTTTLITVSNDAKVYLDGEEFVNKSKVDFSLGSKIFTIEAPDGTKREWTSTVTN
jgi:hypothetical protein